MADLARPTIKLDVDGAIRDPLFWVCLILDRLTFGCIDTGRWRRYVIIREG